MEGLTVNVTSPIESPDVKVLVVKGFLDTTTAPNFEKTFQEALNNNYYKLIIDLSGVNYISSAGWGIFVGELRRIRESKGNLFLVGMNEEVFEVFELLGFNAIIQSFSDVPTAIREGFQKS